MRVRVCVFEDRGVHNLEPIALSRPAFDLLCGTTSLLERQCRHFSATAIGALVRPALAPLCRLTHPQLAVNDPAWLSAGPTIMVNARWLPPSEPLVEPMTPRLALAGDQVAFVVLPPHRLGESSAENIDECVESWKMTLPSLPAGGHMMDYPWNLVEHNAETISQDFPDGMRVGEHRPATIALIGPSERLFVDPTAQIDPLVVVDTTHGPVIIEPEVRVQAFSRLEGPCYIGPGTWVQGAKISGSTIGPVCRIGGEVEASIVQGHSNKGHEGFLGHSYLGEWVNLAAGTQVSDLRNDYGPVTIIIAGEKIDTGLTKVGSFIGDHTKTGLNTLLNTGAVVGAFCTLLPTGSLLPREIPSFCRFWYGQLQENEDLSPLLDMATRVMARRSCELTGVHAEFFRGLCDATAIRRRQVIRESEQRRLRRSM